ncbi:MAG: sulfite exporter TauE/SafE family protein [Alphaproteobacteria bacterium]
MLSLLPPDLTLHGLAFLLATAFIAAMARGFSGFGAALIFVPLASTVVAPQVASPLLLITDAVLAAGFIPDALRKADRREVSIMALGAAIGIPFGTLMLVRLDALTIRWSIVVLAGAMLALLVSGWRYRGKPTAPLTFTVGGIAGVFSGAAQTGGPAVVAYWLGSPATPAIVRANIILYFSISTAIAMVSYYFGGVLTLAVAKLALIVGPVYGLGLFIGARLFGIADEGVFRRICYALIAIAVLVSLPLLDGVIR